MQHCFRGQYHPSQIQEIMDRIDTNSGVSMQNFYHRQASRLVQISPFERFVPVSVYNILFLNGSSICATLLLRTLLLCVSSLQTVT